MTSNPFQDIILAYAREKIGAGRPVSFDVTASEVNALCGDAVTVYASRRGGHVQVSYEVTGCSLCTASASIMSAALATLSVQDGIDLVSRFLSAFPKGHVMTSAGPGVEALFDLKRFPARELCVLLPWQALKQSLQTET